MILYTLVPYENIFPLDAEEFSKHSVVNVNGVQLVVEQNTNMEWTVVQLLSSNPSDYLNNAYQPGAKITLRPNL
jgi:hypothetical protein